MLKSKISGTIAIPEIDLTDSIKHIGNKIIIPLLQDGIDTNTDINGNRFPPVENSTLRAKRKKGHGDQTLVDEGLLIDSFRFRKRGKSGGEIFIKDSRKDIANRLQINGVGRKKKKFKFFGISDGMEKEAHDYLEGEIKEKIRNARPRRL